jgi:hypothetical protein
LLTIIFEWEGGREGGGKEDGDCVNKDRDGVQSILSSTATTMMASVLTPEMVANDGDRGMDGRTLSKEVVATNNGAKRAVLVHVYHQNFATQGPIDDNAAVTTTVAESHD